MRTAGRGVAAAACTMLLTGCAAAGPQLLSPRPVDSAAFTGVLATTSPAVAKVSGTSCSGFGLIGSAFVAGDRMVLTAAHVVTGARTIELRFPGLPVLAAQVVGIDADDDTALLRVVGQLPPALTLEPAPAAAGDQVGVVGFPIADTVARTSVARISALDDRASLDGHQLRDLTVVDAEVPTGSSGGPVVDSTGRVRAMVSAQIGGRGGRDSSARVTLAIPAERLADRLVDWGRLPAKEPCS